jgi:hypothetical protein
MAASTTAAPATAIPRRWLLGIVLCAASLLVLEVCLTRIFSVIMSYHFAAVSISLALFGTALAGVVIYVRPRPFYDPPLDVVLARLGLAYSISVVVALLLLLGIPVVPSASVAGLVNLAVFYLNLTVPFFLGALVLATAIARLNANVGAVYGADLGGASLGCLVTIPLLNAVGGPGAILCAALIALAGATCFLTPSGRRLRRLAGAWAGALFVLLSIQLATGAFGVQFVKGAPEAAKLYERWNSYSRVAVFPDTAERRPFGWGLSNRYEGANPGYMLMNIDADAATPIMRYDGDPASLDFLRYDASSIVYHLQPPGKTLIIGPGGGRDVLTALLFGQREIDAVELNPLVIDAVATRFADYAGHVYADPRVHITVDDGRNYLARSPDRYDVVQLSAVDTFAATQAGSFALAENTLYTREAFREYYRHLADGGVLQVGRFVVPVQQPYAEVLRLAGLGLTSWQENGVAEPARHAVVAGVLNETGTSGYMALLLKKSPWTRDEIDRLINEADTMGFTLLYTPFTGARGELAALFDGGDPQRLWDSYPLDVTPPTDDRPFFFQMLRLTDVPRFWLAGEGTVDAMRVAPMLTLVSFLVIVFELTLACLVAPLWLDRRAHLTGPPGRRSMIGYFCCLGFGYMLVEVALIQKLVLLLGHPTYALATVLFAMLVASGAGSLLTSRVPPARAPRVAMAVGVALVVALPAYAALLPPVQAAFMGSAAPLKTAIACALIVPLAALMGTLFPLGIQQATRLRADLLPSCWAANGATSVFASVLALALGVQFGIGALLLLGAVAYAGAVLCLAVQGWAWDLTPPAPLPFGGRGEPVAAGPVLPFEGRGTPG